LVTFPSFLIFSYTATAPPDIYTLSLHDALPICPRLHRLRRPFAAVSPGWSASAWRSRRGASAGRSARWGGSDARARSASASSARDRKSTRLNSSHLGISYAVFCLKKKREEHYSR